MYQELDHVKVTSICRQPERGVPFLVPYVDMGTPAKKGKKNVLKSHMKTLQLKGWEIRSYGPQLI